MSANKCWYDGLCHPNSWCTLSELFSVRVVTCVWTSSPLLTKLNFFPRSWILQFTFICDSQTHLTVQQYFLTGWWLDMIPSSRISSILSSVRISVFFCLMLFSKSFPTRTVKYLFSWCCTSSHRAFHGTCQSCRKLIVCFDQIQNTNYFDLLWIVSNSMKLWHRSS